MAPRKRLRGENEGGTARGKKRRSEILGRALQAVLKAASVFRLWVAVVPAIHALSAPELVGQRH